MAQRSALTCVALAAVLVLAVGLGSAGRTERAERPIPAIDWHPCRDGAECGTLEVPLDHADPSGRTIRLFVARRPAADPHERLGTLLYLPGDASGMATPRVLARDAFGDDLRRRFDLVAVDLRGASAGTQVLCLVGPAWFLAGNALPESDVERAREAERWRAYAGGCEERSGWLLPHLSTAARAHDLDLLRAALDEEGLTIFGQEYGAALASVYARLFPRRVRAAVLEGGHDPAAPLARLAAEQAAAAEGALTSLLERCAEDENCPLHAGGDPFGTFDALLARLQERPLRHGWRSLTRGDALGATKWGLATHQQERLLHALAAAVRGDPRMLRTLADERLRPAHTTTAISCRDRAPEEWALGAAAVGEIRARAPRLGDALARGDGGACLAWPAEPDLPPELASAPAAPVLVVGSTEAVATPLAWSRDLVRGLDGAALLVAEYEGADAYFSDGVGCVREAVDAFLVSPAAIGGECRPGDAHPRAGSRLSDSRSRVRVSAGP